MLTKSERKKLQLTQNSDVSADGLDYKGGRFTHNASLQTRTPGPDLLRPCLQTDDHIKWTEKEKRRNVLWILMWYSNMHCVPNMCVCTHLNTWTSALTQIKIPEHVTWYWAVSGSESVSVVLLRSDGNNFTPNKSVCWDFLPALQTNAAPISSFTASFKTLLL